MLQDAPHSDCRWHGEGGVGDKCDVDVIPECGGAMHTGGLDALDEKSNAHRRRLSKDHLVLRRAGKDLELVLVEEHEGVYASLGVVDAVFWFLVPLVVVEDDYRSLP